MTKKRFFLLAIIFAWLGRDGARAQQKQPVTSVQPDCMVFFNITAASSGAQAAVNSVGTSAVIDNHQVGCYGWTVAYTSFGFSVVSLSFQSAPDNAGGTGPGTWVNFAGTLVVGINPNTAITQAITTATGYYPWLRMNLTSKTGTGAVRGVLYGFKVNSAANGGIPASTCPGGLTTQVQYNNAGVCAGSSTFTYGAARDEVLIPNGAVAPGFPGLGFTADPTVGLYYDAVNGGTVGIDDVPLTITARGSGVNTFILQDNDSWHCSESDQLFQRGVCEFFSSRASTNVRFFDITDQFVSWGDPAGALGGSRVGVGRFTSEGANAKILHSASGDGGSDQPFQASDLITPGCTFANLTTCFGSTNSTRAYCTDCTVTSSIDNTAASGGSGCSLARINSVWKCTSL